MNKLNIAAYHPAVHTLGPGKRFAIWVQGCCFCCPQCIAPEWIPRRINRLITIEELVHKILDSNNLEGLTLSGGEPMLQAGLLHKLVKRVKSVRAELSVICYTGFTLKQLHTVGTNEQQNLLESIDVLIDGTYVHQKNNDLGLRGSTNQYIHFLSDVYKSKMNFFAKYSREFELNFNESGLMLVGVPPKGVNQQIRSVLREALK